jgi:hypothetical protein
MKKKGTEDLDKEFESDDELYASYDAYKALLEAGVPQKDALKRTGLTPQIVKDLEAEEDADESKDEFKDAWYSDEDDDESNWEEKGMDGDVEDWDESNLNEDYDDSDWDDRF